jgi:hypothetical protein
MMSIWRWAVRLQVASNPETNSLHADQEKNMKYLCLIYDEEKKRDTISKTELDAIVGEFFALTTDLRSSGHHISSEPLQSVTTAKTVRIRNSKISVTDGPFAETKEQLGGFYLIDAKDMDEAVAIAGRIPSARSGSIEVRQVRKFG